MVRRLQLVRPAGARAGAAVAHRVLLLGARRQRVAGLDPVALAEAVAHRLGGDVPVGLEVLLDLATGARLLSDHPQLLERYDAVVVVAPPGAEDRWLRDPRRRRAVEQALAAAPLLLVEVGAPGVGRRAARPARHATTPAEPLLRPVRVAIGDGTDGTASVRRIARSLQQLLQPRAAAADAHEEEPPTGRWQRRGVDAVALRRLRHIAALARSAYGVQCAEINLLGRSTVTTVAAAGGGEARNHRRGDTLCDLAARSAGLTVIGDTRQDPEAGRRPTAQGDDGVRFYAGHPIRSGSGEPIAVLCVHDRAPQDADDFDFDLLRDLALLAEGELVDAARRAG